MNFQGKEKDKHKYENQSRFIYLSPSVYKCDGYNLQFTAFDTHLRCRVLIQRYSRQLPKDTLSQIQLLRHLEHDNLAFVHNLMLLSCAGPTYVISELLDTSLEQLIYTNQLTFNHASLFSYQMLRGLKYLHSADLHHTRICPSNVLVNCHSLILKLSHTWQSSDDKLDTNGEHSYCSPEVLMDLVEMGDIRKADMWSVGCLLVEMVVDRNIFQGHEEHDTLLRIIDSVPLKEYDWMKVFKFFPTRMLKNHCSKPRHPVSNFLTGFDANLINLLENMLQFSPGDRISTHQSLSHPFFSDYHCPEDEPVVDPEVLRILQRLAEHEETDFSLGEGCSVEDLWSLELQAGFPCDYPPQNDLIDYLSTPEGTLLKASSTFDAPKSDPINHFGSCQSISHSITIPERMLREQSTSMSSSSSGSVHSAATYRHNLKELQSRLKQKYAGDSDKEQAELSEEKWREEEEIGMVVEALEQLGRNNQAHNRMMEDSLPSDAEDSKVVVSNDIALLSNDIKNKEIKINEIKLHDVKINNIQIEDLKMNDIISTKDISPSNDLIAERGVDDGGMPPKKQVLSVERVWGREGCDKEGVRIQDGDEGEIGKRKRCRKGEVGKRMSDGCQVWRMEGKQNTDPFDHPPSDFDKLYRLPTDHLRRYADDMNHSLHGHHFFRDDVTCRTSRLSESGACGGCDYGSLDDLPSAFSSTHHLSKEAIQHSEHIDHHHSSHRPLKRSGSDSSLESPPNSPPFSTYHTGARPKRSPKGFFK